ncbi:hypothetical protein Lal_00025523 [Lupinus albus]|nr:hypothetical protein Lal_00025523 [Lupinus albus]
MYLSLSFQPTVSDLFHKHQLLVRHYSHDPIFGWKTVMEKINQAGAVRGTSSTARLWQLGDGAASWSLPRARLSFMANEEYLVERERVLLVSLSIITVLGYVMKWCINCIWIILKRNETIITLKKMGHGIVLDETNI